MRHPSSSLLTSRSTLAPDTTWKMSLSPFFLVYLVQAAEAAISVAALKLSRAQVTTVPTASFPCFLPQGWACSRHPSAGHRCPVMGGRRTRLKSQVLGRGTPCGPGTQLGRARVSLMGPLRCWLAATIPLWFFFLACSAPPAEQGSQLCAGAVSTWALSSPDTPL